ncbi:kinesin light chain [Colletotrichum spaethianum]|uniref:Kinesin light chain n=1 Tax=Colletotrichum spaethianum TaxID=700344 RepID=A0AA37PA47_9PEZI|nr:kinesin light chain [Colletotrichum spaethianum]GKT48470.1 kinesin light chain [Colletotrichum spaethianum]
MGKSVPARDFTVGWVCALPIELAAAAEMMDEEFAELPSQPTDSNVYSFGRVGDHNVVAACMPAGQMGTAQAATVASQMKNSFPSLRFSILVGVGGGVPNLDEDIDIRLGDVVISQPAGQHGGVIQYDFGKTGPDGRITRTGSLNAPPTILLNALAKLRANDFRGKTQVLTHLSKLTPSTRSRFASPGPDQDSLYNASALHITGATCKKCRSEDIVDRDARATTDPVLFFGNIASGNQVMKDGLTRDRYSQELGGVLCFEMEAAGLMNNFPFIVIRGICDYADAHKNKRWQPYAAVTAAACAKELLYTIPPLVSSNSDVTEDFPFGRNEIFVGRDAMLTQLLERIPPSAYEDTCQRTAIVGLGGIGKTQVAIEAAYRVRNVNPGCSVFWVPAVDMAMFENAYRKIGQALNIRGIEDDQADVKSLVKAALEQNDVGSWLLIIDNADDMELLFTGSNKLTKYLPFSRNGSILLTTRNLQAAVRFSPGQVTRLREMSITEATQLLRNGLDKRQINDDHSTAQLLEQLAYLPLAIRQASAYMAANTNVTVSKYLEYCNSSNAELVKLLSKEFDDQDRYESIQNPVTTTWLISFEHISRDSPLAAKYLSFICYLGEKDIPRSLLSPGENEIDTDEAVGTLIAYAFILQRDAADRFDIHRLVRLVMRNWLREQRKEEEQVTETIYWLSKMFPWPHHGNRKLWMSYLPHAQAALEVRGWCTDEEGLWDLLDRTGISNFLLGYYGKAEQIIWEALVLKEKALGLENLDTLMSMSNLAITLDKQGKYREAEQMNRQTLKLREKVLGLENPDTLINMSNLAITLKNQGKYEEAEQMNRQTLKLREKVLGLENPDTLMSMSNLAITLKNQGKYREAEQMNRQTLKLMEKVLGLENPDTLMSMSNLAITLNKQGKYEEAEQMNRQTLKLREKVLGLENPDTLRSMGSLAITLNNQGKYEEAEQMQRQALELREKVLGLENPDTLSSMGNLAVILDCLGSHEEAEQLFEQTLKLSKKLLGPDHPFTRRVQFDLQASLEAWTDSSSVSSSAS